MCEFYSNLGLKTKVLRDSNAFGKYDRFDLKKSHIIGASMIKILNAKDNEAIEVWGSLNARRDFLYIDDLIDVVEKSMKNQPTLYGLYNCGLGYSVSINEVVKKIINISGKNENIKNNLDKPDNPTALSLNRNKAKEQLGWEPTKNLEEGLRYTYEG